MTTRAARPDLGSPLDRRAPRADVPLGQRQLRIAIVLASIACLAVLAARASAEPLDAVVRAKLAPMMPAGLDVARIYLPAQLARLDLDPAKVSVELARELRAGRPSIKLTIRGRAATRVPIALAALVDGAVAQRDLATGDVIADGDFAIERRAVADLIAAPAATLRGASVGRTIAAGAPIATRDVALPPPLARGTQVEIEVRRGAVHVRGTGILELAARPGEPATARLIATKLVVHGTLVAPATLIVGE